MSTNNDTDKAESSGKERVQKIMSNAGFCARRKAEALIEQGKVRVNGKVITLGDQADPSKDTITIDALPGQGGKRVTLRKVTREYWLMHKPVGLLTTCDDKFGRDTIMKLLRKELRDRGVYPVGRLDRDASGLLFLTNDGGFANHVLHPSFEVEKTYIASLDRPLMGSDAKKLERGVAIDGKRVRPKLRVLREEGPKVVEVRVHEGMHKVIKRLFKVAGYRVEALARVRIGPVRLDIKPGKLRRLHKNEISFFLKKERRRKDVRVKERAGHQDGPEKKLEKNSRSAQTRAHPRAQPRRARSGRRPSGRSGRRPSRPRHS